VSRRGNPSVRVWEEVWTVYREVAKKHGLKISDLVSIVLLYAPVFSPLSVVVGLEDNYDITREEALAIAFDLKGTIENLVSVLANFIDSLAKAEEESKEKEVLTKVRM